MKTPKLLLTLLHRLALLPYLIFALFPIYWLIKVSVTPTNLLYSEGVRLWPFGQRSSTTPMC